MEVVLIVEDDTPVRQVLEQALEEVLGIRTVLAANGLEALEMAWAVKPVLVVLDIRMPELDGVAVIKALRSRAETEALPVIAVSASPQASAEALHAGATAFLAKPFLLEEFLAIVQAHLGAGHAVAEQSL